MTDNPRSQRPEGPRIAPLEIMGDDNGAVRDAMLAALPAAEIIACRPLDEHSTWEQYKLATGQIVGFILFRNSKDEPDTLGTGGVLPLIGGCFDYYVRDPVHHRYLARMLEASRGL
ncbi:hypothetical protein [Sphingobium sp. Leaf26]|uniref:hypothetical protein n=1 Tax=Sphingobium sp. Leaf26 TaxID=1735693 RepID=UPI000A952F8D|nr:hypothetical protein [Sphingobium sp. Leaf26]